MNKRVYPNDVLGISYTTKFGNTLSVIKQISSEGLSIFSMECNICSKDKELFLEGDITGTIRNIRKKMTVCGCNNGYRWNKRQQEVRIHRILKDSVYKFKAFEEEDSYGSDSYVLLTNTITNKDKRILVCNLMAGHLPSGKIYSDFEILEINSCLHKHSHFPEGCKVTPNYNGTKKCWDFTCPVCTESIYVKEGIHSGIFPARLDALKDGRLPCYCSGKYAWSIQEREFLLKRLCNDIGYTFLGIKDWEPKKKTFKYLCTKGHKRKAQIHTFIYQNKRCKLCSKDAWNMSGYYPDRVDEEDTLYLLKFETEGESFIKIGRTFHLDVRKYYYPKEYTVTTLGVVKDTHGIVYDEEQRLQGLCNKYHYSPLIKFGGSVKECFMINALDIPEIKNIFSL